MPQGERQAPAPVPDENEEFLAGILDEQDNPKPQPKPARKPASRPAAAETQDDDQPRPAPKAQHDPKSLELAEYFGLDPLDVAGMTPDQLDRKVTRLSHAEFARQHAQARQTVQAPAPQPAAAPAENEDQWGKLIGDPEQARFFREKEQATRQEIAELKKQLAERTESDKARAVAQRDERLDDAFGMLPAELAAYYGDATAEELKSEGKVNELRRRMAVLALAQIDLSKPLPAARVLSRRLQAAHAILHPQPEQPDESEEEIESPYNPGAVAPVKSANRGHQNVRGPNGKYAGPAPRISQRDWDNGSLMRPGARKGGAHEADGERSGYPSPDEFDLE